MNENRRFTNFKKPDDKKLKTVVRKIALLCYPPSHKENCDEINYTIPFNLEAFSRYTDL